MPNATDLTGRVFDRLTVIRRRDSARMNGRSYAEWECRCECGNPCLVKAQLLLAARTKSCGCLKKDFGKLRFTKHGLSHRSEYGIWTNMIARCENPTAEGFRHYGGRGITVCREWRVFTTFFHDMGERPTLTHTLDRRDNNGPYSKDNCRWASRTVQSRNNRRTRRLEAFGKSQCLTDWAQEYSLSPNTLRHRLSLGMPLPTALVHRRFAHFTK